MTSDGLSQVHHYHDETKHRVGRYARSLGYLDWASQPRPFRSYEGAPQIHLYPDPSAGAGGHPPARLTYDQLFARHAAAAPITVEAIGDFLRHALGLSAWKVFQQSRWSLRVNPSSGNLHPTEAYLVTGAVAGLSDVPAVCHYAADRHLLERRCDFDLASRASDARAGFLVALTSIHWRESWKYGERAFRYCQHDVGHAIAAISFAARLRGWQVTMLPGWSHRSIAALVGLDRSDDFFESEPEEPACLLMVDSSGQTADSRSLAAESQFPADEVLVEAVRRGRWLGRASQLSEDHVEWTFIDEIARATEENGRRERSTGRPHPDELRNPAAPRDDVDRGIDARTLIVQRRSAVALDGVASIDRAQFVRMLSRTLPGSGAPWNAIWWTPRIHLAIFVHRVTGMAPGLYLLVRSGLALARLRAACHSAFSWEAVEDDCPLWLLQRGDYRGRSKGVSCDQDIAADGFFSLGMIADFDASLSSEGRSFYRHLYWESGVIGQVLYLEAEAAGARATGIGCFFDDEVHALLGLEDHAFQSLYHFTVGMPVDDTRLTTEPGYAWEVTAPAQSARARRPPSEYRDRAR